jgi:PAS domain S-box-containing protein
MSETMGSPMGGGQQRSWLSVAGLRRGQAWILLVVFAAVVAAAVYSYREIDRELTQSALSRRTALSYLAAAVLTEKFDRLVDIGVALGSRVRFRELVEAGNWADACRILSGVPVDFPFIDRIALVDLRGTMMADVPAVAAVKGQNLAHRDWYQAVMRTEQPYISQVYKRVAPPQFNVFVATVPIKSSQGAMLGLLVLQVRSDRFFDWIAGVDVGAGGLVYVVDRKGMLAAHPRFSPQGDLIDYSGVPVVQRMLQGTRGIETIFNPVEKEERLVAYEPIPRHGWGVVLEQPTATVFATRDAQLRRVQIAYGLIFLFVISAAYLTSRIVVQRKRAQEDGRIKSELMQAAGKLELEVAERRRAQEELAKSSERLAILHEIDISIIAAKAPVEIAETALQRLRNLIGVPRAIVNIFDLAAGEAEWLAAVGRRRTHRGPVVRFPMKLMGDVESLRRGELQMIDVDALPAGPEADALLASGVHEYMVVPMIAGGELIGGLSFGGARGGFPPERVSIAREVAAQLAIAIAQGRLYERVTQQAHELERRVAERTAQLEATTHELEDLYNHSPCGYHSVDANGLIIRINDTELSWLGYSREEVVGKMHHPDLMTDESAEYFRREAFPLFRQRGWLRNVEFSYVRKDGSVMPASLNATSVRDAQGNYLMSRSTIYDITDRKRAEAGVAAQFRMLQSIIDNLPGAVSLFDRDLTMTACNNRFKTMLGLPAELFRRGPPSFESLIHYNALHGEYGPGDPAQITAQIVERARHAVAHCFERTRPDGTVLEIRGTPMPDGGFVTYYSDITERKRAEEKITQLNADLERRAAQLEISNKELEGFSYSVSHDLRSPLRAVDGYSQMLEEDYGGKLDDEGRRLLGVIRRSSQKMGVLIDDLLAFSHLGRKSISAVKTDMNALVNEVVEELGPAAGDIASHCEIGTLPDAWCDRALLRQVWVNLLSNALKYSGNRNPPAIRVAGHNGGAENVYSVSDNGAGFDMQYYDKLFGVFQRLHSEEEFAGTGVGLAIVQRVVTRHGGRVWAEGKVDAGATFYFALPAGGERGLNDAG